MPTSHAVYRSRGSAWLIVIAAALALFFIIDAAVRGFWIVALATAAWSAFVVGVLAVVLLLPALRVDEHGLTIVNPFVTTAVPWSRVADLDSRRQLMVATTEGSSIAAVGVPRPSARARATGQYDVLDEIEAMRAEHAGSMSDAGAVTRTVHTGRITALIAAAVVATAISVLL